MMTTPLFVLASVLSTTPPTLPDQIDACWVSYRESIRIIHESVDDEMVRCLSEPDPVLCQANALNALRVASESAWLGLLNCLQDAVLDHFGPNFMPQGFGGLLE